MKKLLFAVVALVVFSIGILRAQDVTGTWQGTLQAGRPLRIVIQISNVENGLKAILYSIDQGGQSMTASTVTLQGTTLRIAIPAIGGSYEGRLSADGGAITGTFSQGQPLPLTLTRATAETAWTIPTPPAPIAPMAANASPAFEVATIKPSNPDAPGKLFTVKGRQVLTINTTVNDLISLSYGVHAKQITGGPAWLETDKYDVTGQPDVEGMPNQSQLKIMLQKLLADRFKLTFHRDTRELSVYSIVAVKPTAALATSTADPNGLPGLFFKGLGALNVRNATLGDFAGVMQGAVLDRPVVNQTGLTGKYDFTLTWTPDESQFAAMGVRVPPPSGDGSAAPGLFTAIQEQLGLKFESTRSPVDVIVVDGVEKPSND